MRSPCFPDVNAVLPPISRRDCLRQIAALTLGVGTALPMLADSAGAARPRQKLCAFEKPVQFLNYEQTAEFFGGLGFDGLEVVVRPGGHVLPERVAEDLPRFAEALERRGLEIGLLTTAITSVREPHAETILRTAARLGIRHYRLGWWSYDLTQPIPPQLEALRPKLKDLAALNHSLGLTGLYQNHAGFNRIGAVVWDIFPLLQEHDPKDLALVFDIRHAMVEAGLSWPTVFHFVKSHIKAAYFKDFLWEKSVVKNVPLGEGQVDKKFAGWLRESGFAGPVSLHVEYAEGRDKEVYARAFRKDLATLRSWMP